MTGATKDGLVECLSGHDGGLCNVKFFRGSRDDLITAEEICAQVKSAVNQLRMGIAQVSETAPRSEHPPIDVRELVAKM